MDATNKNALTVTYGSFSIILEGQENPFDLLRQVTDYYRKIAIENPNFGAIPSASRVVEPVQKPSPTPKEKFQQAVVNKKLKPIEPQENTTPGPTNLWDNSTQSHLQPPLILSTPVSPSENTDTAQIAAANQALPRPEAIAQPERESSNDDSSVIKSRFPFRRFPARAPNSR